MVGPTSPRGRKISRAFFARLCRWRWTGALTLLLGPATSSGQVVRGKVIDANGTTPAEGVVVVLLDSAGNTVARALSDERGEYRLLAASAGTYQVRTLRIGYRPSLSGPIVLTAEQEIVQPALVAGAPLRLDAVRVSGRSDCLVRRDSAAATFAVWEQIRTALAAAQLTAGLRNLSATVVTYQRSLDADGRRVMQQYARITSGITARPWRSVSPDSLRRAGYAVTETDESTTYFAPDLDVLVSEGFAGDHCFRLVSEERRLGIAFEPTRARRHVPEIRGTLWLERASSQLRRLEFRYVNLTREQEAVAGGELEFVRLATGAWLISRWSIRVPVLETRHLGASGFQARGRLVREIRVDGGDLALVTRRRDTLWARSPLTFAGTARDSLTGAGLSAARVTLRGTGLAARTDATGAFRFAGVLPGEYVLDVQTPSLEAIGFTRSLSLTFTDTAAEFTVRLPTADQVAQSHCAGKAGGMVAGAVRMARDSAPVGGTKVVVEWNRHTMDRNGREIGTARAWTGASTDYRGRFRVCGVPRNTAMTVQVEADSGASAPAAVRIPADGHYVVVALVLDPRAARPAVLQGVVLSDVNAEPIPDVEVAIPALAMQLYTNESGAFRMANIPPGSHQVIARRIGYRHLNVIIPFEANRTVERRLLLSRAVSLDTVSVTANALGEEFERNRAMGLGHFLTRPDLERQQQRTLSDILSQVPGVDMRRAGNRAYIASRRGSGTSIQMAVEGCQKLRFEVRAPTPPCACYAQVYVDNALLYGGGESETIPDINAFPSEWIEAIELYAGPSQTPARYSRLNSQCGVLVIHTRRGR